ncbi:acetate kinase [Leptolyngbya sp. 'hensonii']|uniref:acetate kinase n=1 Tax=Leptolyngbya sp. 'hensonii' TaxID=1922337 RepID=UPI00094FA14F|nr:acetate kinase [Leptolyngbya sp. 'hensonii']OLP18824.1 acetate kinase [Leptolyngbya sp. 'hensonii']
MKILILNAGSSSQKSCLYEFNSKLPDRPPHPLWEAQIDWTRQQGIAALHVKTRQGATLNQEIATTSRKEMTMTLLKTLWAGDTQVIPEPAALDVVGHRVVHGGQEYQHSTIVTPAVKAAIARLATLAPAHNPANLEGIEAIEHILGPQIPQVAVFDTAFHSQLPLAAALYPGPYEWFEQGMRRYGFHGISHQYCAERAAQILGRDLRTLRLINCHLGNGCSLAAIREGHSIDTTMGFTPLEGLMMGTRSGSIDPGLLIHLLRQEGYTVDRLDQTLNKGSGLLGISGQSGDLRQIQTAIAAGDARAQLALDLYIHRLRSSIGAMLASLGGLDAMIFTAGVGENSSLVRAAACEAFGFLGWKLDSEKNEQRLIDQDLATPNSSIRILVIHTQEDWAIARECQKLLSQQL